MLDRVRKLFASAGQAVQQVAFDYVQAYVRQYEKVDRWQIAARADLMVSRINGSYAIAVDGNAWACAGASKVRLYRKTRSKSKAVKGKRLAYLRGELTDKPHAKTAEFVADGGDLEEVLVHPVLDFLNQPNPWMTGAEWSYLRFKAREATGNAFSWVYADKGRVEAYWLPPQCVRIVAGDDAPIEWYRFSRNNTDWLTMDPSEVFHTKLRPSLQDYRLGETWGHYLLKQLDIQEAATDAELARQRNGSRPDFFIETPKGTTPDQRNEILQKLQNDHRGPAQAGKVMVGTAEMKLVPVGFAPKDLLSENLLDYYDRMIDKAAGRPESISKLNDAGRANADAGLVQYMRYTIAPRVNQDAADLTLFILPLFGLKPGEWILVADNCIPEDDATEATTAIAQVNAGVITWNEHRAELGLDPYEPEIGDVPRVNGVPAQTAADMQAARDAQPEAVSQNEIEDDEDDVDTEKKKYGTKALAPLPPDVDREVSSLRPKIAAALRRLAEDAPMNKEGTPDLTEFKRELSKALEEQRREEFWKKVAAALLILLLRAGVEENEAKKRTRTIIDAEESAGNSNLWTKYNAFAVDRISESTTQIFLRHREDALRRLEQEAMRAAQEAANGGSGGGVIGIPPGGSGGSGGSGGGSGGKPPMPQYNPELLDRLGPNATPAQIRVEIAEEEAWKAALDEVAPRAEKIAEYETFAANNLGRMAASDLAAYKWLQWYTFEDDRVCVQCTGMVKKLSAASLANPDCPKELRGKPVQRVDVSFTEEGDEFSSINEVVGPPLHVFCRCTIDTTEQPVLTEYRLTIEDTSESATQRFGRNKTRLFRMFEKLYREQLEQHRREREKWRGPNIN